MDVHPLDQYKLLGISGKIGSGKTTLAHYIMILNPDMTRHSFAEKLRQVVSLMTNIPVERTRTSEEKNHIPPGWGKSVGTMLQDVGNAIRQGVHPDAWVLSLLTYFDQEDSEQRHWVIDDVRYPNEADAIRERGGVLIRLNGDPGHTRKTSNRNLQHESETALDDYSHFDVIINTDQYESRLTELYTEIGRQLSALK